VTAGAAGSLLSVAGYAQNASLPTSSAPSAYGESVSTGVAAGSSTYRSLSPPQGAGGLDVSGLSLSLSLGASWHSNPEREAEDRTESDAAMTLSPRISYSNELGRHQYEVGYSAGSESYGEFEDEDSDWHRVHGALKLNLTEKLVGDVYTSRTEGEEERGAAASRVDADEEDEYRFDVLGARITLGRRSNPLQVYLGGEVNELSFLNNDQEFRDRESTRVEGGLFFNVSPRTAFFVHASNLEYDYLAGDPSLDNTEQALTLGVAWEPSDRISLTFEAGEQTKDFDDPLLESYEGTTYTGKLNWTPRDRTGVSLYASRTTEESPDVDASYYVSELAGIDLSQQLGERGSFSAYYAQSKNKFSNSREDRVTDYGIALGYSAYSWLELGASYNIIDYESSEADQSYDDEIFSVFMKIAPNLGGDS